MSRCAVRMLGRFEVRVDERIVTPDAWRSRRAADVVKVLALAPSQAMHRGQLMALLWPELGEESAGANLRKAVHYARRAMGADEAIRSMGGLLVLWDAKSDVDIARGRRRARVSRSRPVQPRRRSVHRRTAASRPVRALGGRGTRTRTATVAGRIEGAGRWDRVLDIDPTDEQSHRELMTSYLSAGQRRDAIRQFERLRDALREHMGVGRDPETIAVYQRVLAWEGEQHLGDAERIAGLWQGGPYNAAAWEARAAVRAAEGNAGQAAALLREAADEYARCGRRPDEQRCRAALLNAVPA